MPAPEVELARRDLELGHADRALDRLQGLGPEAPAAVHWIRACASARLGRPLQLRVALRDLAACDAPPPQAMADTARLLAEAVLGGDGPLLAAGSQLASALGRTDLDPPALGAWNALVDTSDGRATDVLTLAALARHLGRTEAAIQLARGAQDTSRHDGEVDTFAAATWLLAALCRAEGDPVLAEEVLQHGARWIERLQPGRSDAYLSDAEQLIEAWTQTAPGAC